MLSYCKNDSEWSQYINSMFDGACLLCGGRSTAAHIFSRRFKSLRLCKQNGIPLCLSCHSRFDKMKSEDRKKIACKIIGEKVYNELEENL